MMMVVVVMVVMVMMMNILTSAISASCCFLFIYSSPSITFHLPAPSFTISHYALIHLSSARDLYDYSASPTQKGSGAAQFLSEVLAPDLYSKCVTALQELKARYVPGRSLCCYNNYHHRQETVYCKPHWPLYHHSPTPILSFFFSFFPLSSSNLVASTMPI